MSPQEAREHVIARLDRIPDSDSVLVAKDVLRALVRPAENATEANGWTAREWEDWSNEVAILIPEEWVSNPDAAQESIVLDFVRAAVRDYEGWGRKSAGWDCQYPECPNTKDDGPLYRVNAKGKKGVFMCERHASVRGLEAVSA